MYYSQLKKTRNLNIFRDSVNIQGYSGSAEMRQQNEHWAGNPPTRMLSVDLPIGLPAVGFSRPKCPLVDIKEVGLD